MKGGKDALRSRESKCCRVQQLTAPPPIARSQDVSRILVEVSICDDDAGSDEKPSFGKRQFNLSGFSLAFPTGVYRKQIIAF
jgi:hypothetical protein